MQKMTNMNINLELNVEDKIFNKYEFPKLYVENVAFLHLLSTLKLDNEKGKLKINENIKLTYDNNTAKITNLMDYYYLLEDNYLKIADMYTGSAFGKDGRDYIYLIDKLFVAVPVLELMGFIVSFNIRNCRLVQPSEFIYYTEKETEEALINYTDSVIPKGKKIAFKFNTTK